MNPTTETSFFVSGFFLLKRDKTPSEHYHISTHSQFTFPAHEDECLLFALTKMKYAVVVLLLLAVVVDVSARHGKPGKRRGHHLMSKKCFFTVKNCKECRNGYDCSQCENGFLSVYMPLGRACWPHCPLGFVQDGDTCRIKGQDCSVPNCMRCAANGRCKECSDGFFLIGSAKRGGPTKCVANCPKGFVPDTSPIFAPRCVEEGCSDPLCITCKRGWYRVRLSHKNCHSQCPAGTTPFAGQCIKCKVENCELCRTGILPTHRCNKCKVDFHKFSSYFEDMCLPQCPDGYYSASGRNGGSVCRKGELPMTDEPVTSSEPTPEPETTAWTETSPTTDPFTEPEYTTPTEVTTEPEPCTSTETLTTSDFEPTTTSEQTTTPEPTSEWEWTTSAEPSTEPESTTASPEPTTEPESTSTGDSATIEAITAEPTTEWDKGDWP